MHSHRHILGIAALMTYAVLCGCNRAAPIPKRTAITSPGTFTSPSKSYVATIRLSDDGNLKLTFTHALSGHPLGDGDMGRASAKWFVSWDDSNRLWFYSADVGGGIWYVDEGGYFKRRNAGADDDFWRYAPDEIWDNLPQSLKNVPRDPDMHN